MALIAGKVDLLAGDDSVTVQMPRREQQRGDAVRDLKNLTVDDLLIMKSSFECTDNVCPHRI